MTKTKAGPIHADRLKSFIERIEKLLEERKAIQGDIKDVYSEAKGVGYDMKTMRKVIALRAMDAADRAEQETLLDVYWHALTQIDRVEARVAGGESIRKAAEAEGMPKSTAIRQVTQNRRNEENGSVASPEPETSSEPTLTHERASSEENSTVPDGGVGTGTTIFAESANNESCGGAEGSAAGGATRGQRKTAAGVESGPHDTRSEAGGIIEIHRGATQPKGCAKVVRADTSMSESVAASGDAIRDASAMPLDVVAAPHSEGREHAGSAATAPPACAAPPVTHPTRAENAQVGDTRGEAPANPPISDAQALANLDVAEALFFASRTRAEA